MALSTEKEVLLEGICSNGCIYMNMILTGVEAGMEYGFGLDVAKALQCLREIGN